MFDDYNKLMRLLEWFYRKTLFKQDAATHALSILSISTNCIMVTKSEKHPTNNHTVRLRDEYWIVRLNWQPDLNTE